MDADAVRAEETSQKEYGEFVQGSTDKTVLMRGEFKDLVDELQQEMDKNEFEIDFLRNTKAVRITSLNEAIGILNSLREELTEKEAEARELDQEHEAYMKLCRKVCCWSLCQDICSCLSVRAAIVGYSKESPPRRSWIAL